MQRPYFSDEEARAAEEEEGGLLHMDTQVLSVEDRCMVSNPSQTWRGGSTQSEEGRCGGAGAEELQKEGSDACWRGPRISRTCSSPILMTRKKGHGVGLLAHSSEVHIPTQPIASQSISQWTQSHHLPGSSPDPSNTTEVDAQGHSTRSRRTSAL